MAARSRFLSDGRNHDKKDGFIPARSTSHSIFGRWKLFRRRRIMLALLALWLLYLFFKNLPTDLPPVSERYNPRYGRLHPGIHQWESPEHSKDGTDDSYEGPIKFYDLAETLRSKIYTRDSKGHVLFAISKLDSLPRLLPIACSFAQQNRTRVHLAFMGRQVADWIGIRAMNGISEDECEVHLHNARPDFPAQSSDRRMGISARASLGHIHSAIPLHAVLAGDTDYEDEYFVNALKEKTASMGLSLITLPTRTLGSLSWISSLDASSLKHFGKVHVDIVIQAQAESSASLMRLLRSIKRADYSGWALPRLTIELPSNVDPFLEQYLSGFRWPPDRTGSESKLVVRHRVDAKFVSPAQASIRTVETFYPLVAGESHVLLLSPKVELSPSYFQLLMYTLLEYRYAARRTELVGHLIGFSLDLPTHAPDMKTKAPWTAGHLSGPLVLWQAPSSNAALYFGDRWIEFHAFLSRRLMADPEFDKTKLSPALSHDYPAWLQPMLEMMQARDYYMLYPTFTDKEGSAAVTVHQELHEPPEEFMNQNQIEDEPSTPSAGSDLADDQALTADEEVGRLMRQEHRVYSDSLVTPLLESLSVDTRQSDLIDGSSIPLISYPGGKTNWPESRRQSQIFAEDFAHTIGGCDSYNPIKGENNDIEALFCQAKS
ncbi:uncharacterized protein Z518_03012 [Rhinocladiella mackenziei CBS 650.93]|uniref:Glycosyltransferase 2 n=1 Tax=Rhinocladiella mackenziei CBS 650.93 TaxID=1442369 RepID=A0A0D2IY80_9EURO|nr:uncharacterized protein Z518_03012 [Rhinocladiella mackenziei CBS 650.93]KIX08356.1 hypothetical protein Z518_03012 [Rhinocladiella mackenziei CBS 650.93]